MKIEQPKIKTIKLNIVIIWWIDVICMIPVVIN